jgi:hypothetical protein
MHLSRADLSVNERLRSVAAVLRDMSLRHRLAIEEADFRLIHYDSNLGNILLEGGTPVHVDFEMGRPGEEIERSAARELRKFCIEVLNVLGVGCFDAFLGVLCDSYAGESVLRRLAEEEFSRPFSGVHLRRDRRRKARNPGLITKIDLAVRVAERLGIGTARAPGAQGSIGGCGGVRAPAE